MQIFEIFNRIPARCKRVDYLSNTTCKVTFVSKEVANVALETLSNYDEAIAPMEKEGPGIYRARHGWLKVRIATSNDVKEGGFKAKFRAGKIVREFREEVQRTGTFFETPKAAFVSGNMDICVNPNKRTRAVDFASEEPDSDEEAPEDILGRLMKADRKIYRIIERQASMVEEILLQEQQKQQKRAFMNPWDTRPPTNGWNENPRKRGREWEQHQQYPQQPFQWGQQFGQHWGQWDTQPQPAYVAQPGAWTTGEYNIMDTAFQTPILHEVTSDEMNKRQKRSLRFYAEDGTVDGGHDPLDQPLEEHTPLDKVSERDEDSSSHGDKDSSVAATVEEEPVETALETHDDSE
eukprot:GEMP01021360.1.p1 GENE.GEMP01021360.1~~GEMP01021360.1.p1  ORF type:complete len:393 (+),score=100.31 GEMP01021360.1:134-1180(+)